MVKDQSVGKQTSFRFSATAVRELDWLVRKLGQTQTTIVEASIHRLAEAEGYDRDPKELITALLAHESGHAVLVEALMERGLRLGPTPGSRSAGSAVRERRRSRSPVNLQSRSAEQPRQVPTVHS